MPNDIWQLISLIHIVIFAHYINVTEREQMHVLALRCYDKWVEVIKCSSELFCISFSNGIAKFLRKTICLSPLSDPQRHKETALETSIKNKNLLKMSDLIDKCDRCLDPGVHTESGITELGFLGS